MSFTLLKHHSDFIISRSDEVVRTFEDLITGRTQWRV